MMKFALKSMLGSWRWLREAPNYVIAFSHSSADLDERDVKVAKASTPASRSTSGQSYWDRQISEFGWR